MTKYEKKDILYYSIKNFFKNLLNEYKKNSVILKKCINRELFFKFIIYKIINNNYFINNYYLYELSNIKKKEIYNNIKDKFKIDSGNINLIENKLNIDNLFVLKKFIKSSFYLIRNIFILLINILNFQKIEKEFVIIYSKFAKQDKFDELKIKHFFSKKSIKLFEDRNIIFMNQKSKNFDRYYFSKEPILYLAKNFLDRNAKLVLISRIVKAYMKYIFLIILFKPIVLLVDELIETEIVNSLSENKIANKYFVMNTSILGNIKIWMDSSNEKIETHCYWESVSSFYQIKTNEGNTKINSLNALMNFKNHYVWNLKCAKFVKRFFKNNNKVFLIDPLDLYFTNKKSRLLKKDFNIGIFDLGNFPNIFIGGQLCSSFKNDNNLKSFYMDIAEIISEIENEYKINIQILIKRKLAYKKEATDFFLNIKKLNNNFNVIDHDVELTSLFKNLDTIICMPYTSVGFNFTKLEKKASFFFDNSSKIKKYKLPNDIYLINDKKELKDKLLTVYKNLH